jgi:hypothetical protein
MSSVLGIRFSRLPPMSLRPWRLLGCSPWPWAGWWSTRWSRAACGMCHRPTGLRSCGRWPNCSPAWVMGIPRRAVGRRGVAGQLATGAGEQGDQPRWQLAELVVGPAQDDDASGRQPPSEPVPALRPADRRAAASSAGAGTRAHYRRGVGARCGGAHAPRVRPSTGWQPRSATNATIATRSAMRSPTGHQVQVEVIQTDNGVEFRSRSSHSSLGGQTRYYSGGQKVLMNPTISFQ